MLVIKNIYLGITMYKQLLINRNDKQHIKLYVHMRLVHTTNIYIYMHTYLEIYYKPPLPCSHGPKPVCRRSLPSTRPQRCGWFPLPQVMCTYTYIYIYVQHVVLHIACYVNLQVNISHVLLDIVVLDNRMVLFGKQHLTKQHVLPLA